MGFDTLVSLKFNYYNAFDTFLFVCTKSYVNLFKVLK